MQREDIRRVFQEVLRGDKEAAFTEEEVEAGVRHAEDTGSIDLILEHFSYLPLDVVQGMVKGLLGAEITKTLKEKV